MTKINNDKWDNSISYHNYNPENDTLIKLLKLNPYANCAQMMFEDLAVQIYQNNKNDDICQQLLNNDEDMLNALEMFYYTHELEYQQIEQEFDMLGQIITDYDQHKDGFLEFFKNLLNYPEFDDFYHNLKTKTKLLLESKLSHINDLTDYIVQNSSKSDNKFVYCLAAEFVHESKIKTIKNALDQNQNQLRTTLSCGHTVENQNDSTVTFPCGHTFSDDEKLDECPFCNNNDED